MSRKVRSTSEVHAGQPAEAGKASAPVTGTWFINNLTNRYLPLPNGSTYKFQATRELVSDPETIKGLMALADGGNHSIFVDGDEGNAPTADPAPEHTQPADETAEPE